MKPKELHGMLRALSHAGHPLHTARSYYQVTREEVHGLGDYLREWLRDLEGGVK